jgi:uncharacterized membrane protein
MAISRADKRKIVAHLVEFFFVGLVMGIVEDVLAIKLATDAKITPHTFWVAFLVALPFAVISELLVDSKTIRKIISGKPSKAS